MENHPESKRFAEAQHNAFLETTSGHTDKQCVIFVGNILRVAALGLMYQKRAGHGQVILFGERAAQCCRLWDGCMGIYVPSVLINVFIDVVAHMTEQNATLDDDISAHNCLSIKIQKEHCDRQTHHAARQAMPNTLDHGGNEKAEVDLIGTNEDKRHAWGVCEGAVQTALPPSYRIQVVGIHTLRRFLKKYARALNAPLQQVIQHPLWAKQATRWHMYLLGAVPAVDPAEKVSRHTELDRKSDADKRTPRMSPPRKDHAASPFIPVIEGAENIDEAMYFAAIPHLRAIGIPVASTVEYKDVV